ncbi:MAG: DUF6175 family protein [Bacteroidota bacterium]
MQNKPFIQPLLFLAMLSISLIATAQTAIIIPFYKKQGESRQLIIENDPCFRKLETKIKEKFLQNDIQLLDYLAAVRKAQSNAAFKSGSQEDRQTILLNQSNPDIYIVADMERQSSGGYSWIFINLTAYRTSTSRTIGALPLDCGRYRGYTCQDLIDKCLVVGFDQVDKIQEFVDQFKSALKDVSEGIPVNIQFSLSEESLYNYMSKTSSGKLLFQEIKNYLKEHTVDGRSQSNTSTKMVSFPEILVPALDPASKNPLSPDDFALQFYLFLDELVPEDDLESTFDFNFTIERSNIYFEMQ